MLINLKCGTTKKLYISFERSANVDKLDPNEHLVDLKGKKYLPVAPRIAWFRQEKPCWRINTELVEFKHENNFGIAVFQCKIFDEKGNIVSTGYGSETPSDFRDFFEKAETKAIGRALASLGYGTLFALELHGQKLCSSCLNKFKESTHKELSRVSV